jgi:hypothetical protein
VKLKLDENVPRRAFELLRATTSPGGERLVAFSWASFADAADGRGRARPRPSRVPGAGAEVSDVGSSVRGDARVALMLEDQDRSHGDRSRAGASGVA